MDPVLGKDTEKATLKWLVKALEQARFDGQTKIAGYLAEVADEVVFEAEWMAVRESLVG